MNIQIRVATAQAQARVRMLERELAILRTQVTTTSAAAGAMGTYGVAGLSKWGSRIQWAGRQLQYNFTLPILLAGGAAAKFALDNEKAMTRVTKVYGDGSKRFNQLAKTEIPALERSFAALSNEFGVNRAEVIGIAGDWAAAGASGIALAKSTKLTLQTMILGEMSAAEATSALISIQAQYGQSTAQLAKTIDVLNMVENQTGISMQGLIQGFSRAAGVARSAGIDVRHLGAMLAALTPAAGSAAQAGNGLKTMISRILAPTKEGVQVMKLMGINVDALGWKSLNGAQRLEKMSGAFNGLDDAQKAVVSSVIASRYQINRFDVLMRDIANTNGYYQKSLKSTSDAQQNFNQRVKELNVVLNSNPQRLKQMWVVLQNAMANTIQPLIPYIVWLASEVAKMAEKFSNLSPVVQKTVLILLALLAAIGPIGRYVGATATLFYFMSAALHFFTGAAARAFTGMVKFLLLPLRLMIPVLGAVVTAGGAFARAFPLAIMAGVRGAAVAIFAMRTWIPMVVGIGSAMVTAVVGAATAAFTAVAGVAAVGGAAFIAALGPMMINARLAFAAISIAAREVLASVVLSMMRLGAMTIGLSGTITSGLRAVWAAWYGFMLYSWAMLRAGLGVIWVTTYVRLAAISAAGSVVMSGVWARMGAGIFAAATWIGGRLTAMWIVMYARLAAISAAGMLVQLRTIAVGGAAMLSTMAMSFRNIGAFLLRWGKWFVSWPVVIFGAVLGVAYAFRDDIVGAWRTVVNFFTSSKGPVAAAMGGIGDIFHSALEAIQRGFWALPNSITSALVAVVNIIRQAALQVYEWFSYLNPFQRHSPSLVESVTAGMGEIVKQYGRAKNIGNIFSQVARDLATYKSMAARMGKSPFSDERADVAKAFKKALPVFDRLVKDWNKLNAVAARQEAGIARQQKVVDAWKGKLDRANKSLDVQQKLLDGLQSRLDAATSAYEAHQTAIDNFASAPLQGMKQMEEATFSNEMAQKKLQLQMAKWEQTNGSLDETKTRLEGIRGMMELLRGETASLRSAGAGSDITGPMDAQVAALQKQSDAMTSAASSSPMAQWSSELEKLQKQAEIMDLEKSLKFDPLQHQLANLVDTTKELTFEQAVAGIQREQAAQAALKPTIDAMTAAVAAQSAAVAHSTAVRDALSTRYDAENAQLDRLQAGYDKTKDAIQSVESALRDMGSASTDALSKLDKQAKVKGLKKGKGAGAGEHLTPGAQNFMSAKGGNFPDVGGMAKIGREGSMADQAKMIDEFTKQSGDQVAKAFGSINIMEPLKKKLRAAWAWVKESVGPGVRDFLGAVGGAFSGAGDAIAGSGFRDKIAKVWASVRKAVGTAVNALMKVVKLVAPDFKRMWNELIKAGRKLFTTLGPELAKFGPVLKKLGKAFATVVFLLTPFIKNVVSIIGHVLGPVLSAIIDIAGAIIRVVRGIVEVIVGLLSLDFKMAWNGIVDIVAGTFKAIWYILKGAVQIIWGVIEGLVGGVIGWFKWLYDVLVGHSIIPDMVDLIIKTFKFLSNIVKWLYNNVIKPIVDVFKTLWNGVKKLLGLWWSGIKAEWAILKTVARWVWDNVFKPVYNKLVDLWGFVKKAMGLWWSGVKVAWNALKSLGKWVWDNVFVAVYDKIIALWSRFVKPAMLNWWNGMKVAWNAIKGLGKWIWDNVFVAVYDKVTALWSRFVRPALLNWWSGIKTAWNSLKTLGKWVWDNVMFPVYDRITGAWIKIRDWLSTNKDMLTKPVRGIVNTVIRAVNAIGRGLNKVSDILPGIKFHVGIIEEFEAGGVPRRRVGGGFKTTGARAIVGEGKANHPEFVIPTDPTHRRRAQMLLAAAGSRLGMVTGPSTKDTGAWGDSSADMRRTLSRRPGSISGVPAYSIGGILNGMMGDGKDLVKGAGSWIKGNIRKLATTPFTPFANYAANKIKHSGWGPAAAEGGYGLQKAWEWVHGADSAAAKAATEVAAEKRRAAAAAKAAWNAAHAVGGPVSSGAAGALRWARSQVGKPYTWGGVGPNGYDCSGFMSAITNVIRGRSPYSRVGATASFPWGGFSPGVGAFTIGSTPNYGGSGTGHMAGTLNGVNVESRGGTGVIVGSGARGWNDGGFSTHAHLTGLARGAVIMKNRGGTVFRGGEGSNDEAIVPLPRNWRKDPGAAFGGGTGETHNHFEGDLVFPNVKNGDDAKAFIDAIALMAKD